MLRLNLTRGYVVQILYVMFTFIDCFTMLVSCNDICVNIITKYSDYVIAKVLLMCSGGSLQFSILLHF